MDDESDEPSLDYPKLKEMTEDSSPGVLKKDLHAYFEALWRKYTFIDVA